ncbi:MAG TPA: cellulase family glycosylhydrolase [Acetobacteraceae bacterium]|nr:cellulase family glycosylhydrolase [Acetobacteraceae bacterium]
MSGAAILRDGVPWQAKGVTVLGAQGTNAYNATDPAFVAAIVAWGPAEIANIKATGADMVRVQVQQAYADPQSPVFDAAYLAHVKAAISTLRDNGFVVQPTMFWLHVDTANLGTPDGPGPVTWRAWRALMPLFACDQGVMPDIANEPLAESDSIPQSWWTWQAQHQPIVDMLRSWGANNAVVVEAMIDAFYMTGATPAVAGSGYVVGDVLTAVGGVYGYAATYSVATIDGGGGCVTVTLKNKGSYYPGAFYLPPSPAATTGGHGSGCTLTLLPTTHSLSTGRTETGNTLNLSNKSGLADPRRAIIYSIHLYLPDPATWVTNWSSLSGSQPVQIGEWNMASQLSCSTDTATYVTNLLNAVKTAGFGLLVWAYDQTPEMVTDLATFTPTTYAAFACGGANIGGPGNTISNYWKTGTVALQ